MQRWFTALGIVIIGTNMVVGVPSIASETEKKEPEQTVVQETSKINMSDYVTSIDQIKVDPSIKIVGLGEATHGNAELQELKESVFKALVQNNGCKIFAIEGDFGRAQKVNEYINGGEGTAKEAVETLDFKIYSTEEMAHLVQWMREYNDQAEEGKKLKFYGFDMQRYDYNKAYALEYLKKVDEKTQQKYEALLKGLNDDTKLSSDDIKKAMENIETLLSLMEKNKEQYVKKTSQKDYEFAYQCVKCLRENAQLKTSNMNYSELRDSYMADKVKWISDFENQEMIFINGHNGHIMKTSDGLSYHTMGSRLSKLYGNKYYNIGTDFAESQFNAHNNKGEMKTFTVSNSNMLVGAFSVLEGNEYFMDFSKAMEAPELNHILAKEQFMTNIGDNFETMYKLNKSLYALSIKPVEAYDSIIIVKKCTPTKLF